MRAGGTRGRPHHESIRVPCSVPPGEQSSEIVDDSEAIRALKARYFRTMDTKDWDGMRAVFADDVVMDTTEVGGSRIEGADAFMGFLSEMLADAVTVHHGHMPEIDVTSPTTATGIWSLHDIVIFPNGMRLDGDGHYHETYAKVDGEWLITTSTLTRLHQDLTTPEAG